MQLAKFFLTAILALLSVRTWAVPAASVSQIDVPGATSTFASGINNRGEIVGRFSDAQGLHGYVLRRGTFTTLDVSVSGAATVAIGINDRGQIVGFHVKNLQFHGFLWDKGTFTQIDAPDAEITYLHGINNRGQIVGHSRRDVHSLARLFLWADGVFTFLDEFVPGVLVVSLDGDSLGLNDRGQIVGTYQAQGINHGFLIDDGVVTQIDLPGASSTLASGINNHGQIVGFYDDAACVGHSYFRNTEGSFTVIDALLAESVSAVRINDRSDIVGYFRDQGGVFHGFLWSH